MNYYGVQETIENIKNAIYSFTKPKFIHLYKLAYENLHSQKIPVRVTLRTGNDEAGEMAEALFEKWKIYNNNFFNFWSNIDTESQEIIAKMIEISTNEDLNNIDYDGKWNYSNADSGEDWD